MLTNPASNQVVDHPIGRPGCAPVWSNRPRHWFTLWVIWETVVVAVERSDRMADLVKYWGQETHARTNRMKRLFSAPGLDLAVRGTGPPKHFLLPAIHTLGPGNCRDISVGGRLPQLDHSIPPGRRYGPRTGVVGSDLFSLGSAMHTMCTGRPPFRADSAIAVLRRVCDDRPTPIRELNPDN